MSETNGTPQTATEPVIVIDFARNHDPQDLIRYKGQWVAWSRDGRKVLFASPDPYKLCEMVDAAGLDRNDYVLGGIEAPWS